MGGGGAACSSSSGPRPGSTLPIAPFDSIPGLSPGGQTAVAAGASGSSLAGPSKPSPSIPQQALVGYDGATLTIPEQSQAWVVNPYPAGTLGWEGALPGGKLGYGAQKTGRWVLGSWNRHRLWSLAKGLRFTVAGGGSEAGTLGSPSAHSPVGF